MITYRWIVQLNLIWDECLIIDEHLVNKLINDEINDKACNYVISETYVITLR